MNKKVDIKKDLLLEIATKADIANLRTEILEMKGEIKRLETLIKVLIGLVVVAMSFFSPIASELIKLIK